MTLQIKNGHISLLSSECTVLLEYTVEYIKGLVFVFELHFVPDSLECIEHSDSGVDGFLASDEVFIYKYLKYMFECEFISSLQFYDVMKVVLADEEVDIAHYISVTNFVLVIDVLCA